MDKTFFSFGFLQFYQVGSIIAIAALCAVLVSLAQAHQRRQPLNVVLEAFIFSVPCAMICARIFFVLANGSYFMGHPGEILAFWHGGFLAEGAFIGGVGAIYVYMGYIHRNFWEWMDTFTPGLALAQFFGQIANLANQVGFGYPTSSKLGIYIDFAFRPENYKQYDFFEPICLYQAGWVLALFVIAYVFNYANKDRHWPAGVAFLLYVAMYYAADGIVQGMMLSAHVFEVKMAQFFAIAIALLALSLLMRIAFRFQYRYLGHNFLKK